MWPHEVEHGFSYCDGVHDGVCGIDIMDRVVPLLSVLIPIPCFYTINPMGTRTLYCQSLEHRARYRATGPEGASIGSEWSAHKSYVHFHLRHPASISLFFFVNMLKTTFAVTLEESFMLEFYR